MKIGLDTESCHLLFHNGRIDIFGFIEKAAKMGMDGVMINIIHMEGDSEYIHPRWGCLGGDGPEYLERVQNTLRTHNLYAELAMRGTDSKLLSEAVELAHKIGADLLRTYCCFGKYDENSLREAPEKIQKIVPLLKKYRIKFALENHEEEVADEIIDIIKRVNSPWVGAHCDIGNSMMAWEEPTEAVRKLAPYTFTSHFKDHIVIKDDEEYKICGVPLGKGNIDIDECFRLLYQESTLQRINIEQTYPFLSVFKRERGTGGVFVIGEGAFKVESPPFDFLPLNPEDYYSPPTRFIDVMIKKQLVGLEESVRYMKKVRDKYC